ncbi:MAG: hypothetical protein HKN49_10150 [Gammaproteobacteria bacterium]|nr:hypothetical protein [Gammaproteobacteria bacterium]
MLSGLSLNYSTVYLQKQSFRFDRSVQPVPGGDTLQRAASVESKVSLNMTRTVAVQAYEGYGNNRNPALTMDRPPGQAELLDRMRGAMFSVAGDDRYDSALDFDADGRINFADVRTLFADEEPATAPVVELAPAPAQPEQSADETLKRLRASMFSAEGDDGFDATVDLNSDGKVNFADLAIFRNGGEIPTDPEPAPQPAPSPGGSIVNEIRDAFFATQGDEGYDPALDLNDDGRINFADLAALRRGDDVEVDDDNDADDDDDDIASVISAPQPAPDEADTDNRVNRFEAIRDAFFSQAGDESFNAMADLTGDGRVDFRDLAALRQDDD